MRKLIIASLLILAPTPNPLNGAPKVDKEELKKVDKKDLKQLRSRIDTLQKELADTEESKSEAAGALRDSEQAISAANRQLNKLAQEQDKAAEKLSRLRAQSEQLARDIEIQQSQLEKLLIRRYVAGSGQKEYLALLLNQQEPNQIARNLHYYSYFSQARWESIDALRANLQRLDSLALESQEKSTEIAKIQIKKAEYKKQLEEEKTGQARLLVRISLQADQQRREIAKLKQDEERLTRLVEKLAKLLAEKPPQTLCFCGSPLRSYPFFRSSNQRQPA